MASDPTGRFRHRFREAATRKLPDQPPARIRPLAAALQPSLQSPSQGHPLGGVQRQLRPQGPRPVGLLGQAAASTASAPAAAAPAVDEVAEEEVRRSLDRFAAQHGAGAEAAPPVVGGRRLPLGRRRRRQALEPHTEVKAPREQVGATGDEEEDDLPELVEEAPKESAPAKQEQRRAPVAAEEDGDEAVTVCRAMDLLAGTAATATPPADSFDVEGVGVAATMALSAVEAAEREHLGSKALYAKAPYGRCFAIGSWDDYTGRLEMVWDGLHYKCQVQVNGDVPEESFQIFLGSGWLNRFYPSVADASPYRAHQVLGPSGEGHGLNWTIGRDRRDQLQRGATYDIVLRCPRLQPVSVTWKRSGKSDAPKPGSRLGFSAAMRSRQSANEEEDIAGGKLVAERPSGEKDRPFRARCETEVEELKQAETQLQLPFESEPRKRSKDSIIAPYGDYFVVGSWDNFIGRQKLRWEPIDGCYTCRLRLGPGGSEELFYIVAPGLQRRLAPHMDGATTHEPHRLVASPISAGGRGEDDDLARWALGRHPNDEAEPNAMYDVTVICPRGVPFCVSWAKVTGMRDLDAEHKVGPWRVLGRLSSEQATTTMVYMGQPSACGAVGLVAVKYPAAYQEIQALSVLQDVQGVPPLVDFGEAADLGGGLYYAVPLYFPSLDDLLAQRDIDGSGGRLSWPAAMGLGLALIATLRAIHARGIVYSNIKLSSVLILDGDFWPLLTDFSFARPIGASYFDAGSGGRCEFMSVAAGKTDGFRTPADDLEAVGWLLLRCVMGRLPWSAEAAQAKKKEGQELRTAARRISEAKVRYLEAPLDLSRRYLPAPLSTYLDCVRAIDRDSPYAEVPYDGLMALFAAADRSWEELLVRHVTIPRFVVEPEEDFLIWKPQDGGSEQREQVERNVRIFGTSRMDEDERGLWVEVDPVWRPNMPAFLLERCWILHLDSATQQQMLREVDTTTAAQEAAAAAAAEAEAVPAFEEAAAPTSVPPAAATGVTAAGADAGRATRVAAIEEEAEDEDEDDEMPPLNAQAPAPSTPEPPEPTSGAAAAGEDTESTPGVAAVAEEEDDEDDEMPPLSAAAPSTPDDEMPPLSAAAPSTPDEMPPLNAAALSTPDDEMPPLSAAAPSTREPPEPTTGAEATEADAERAPRVAATEEVEVQEEEVEDDEMPPLNAAAPSTPEPPESTTGAAAAGAETEDTPRVAATDEVKADDEEGAEEQDDEMPPLDAPAQSTPEPPEPTSGAATAAEAEGAPSAAAVEEEEDDEMPPLSAPTPAPPEPEPPSPA